jgi:uncharacterized protein YndB with AHSA1/START domain
MSSCPASSRWRVNKRMADYRFVTSWEIGAPPERVWEAIERPERWAEWWPGLEEVRELEPGDELGQGALEEFVFKSFLPYTLSFKGVIAEVDPPKTIEIRTTGELEGSGRYELSATPAGSRARLTWTVRTNKPWMNLLAPLARPVFVWNHDRLMSAGAGGLQSRLGAPVIALKEEGESTLRAALPVILAITAGWFVYRLFKSGR